MTDFKLPSLGADMDEGTLVEWRVAPGQAVKKGDVIAVVDTSKAAVDIEVWDDATVAELITAVGEKIPVGTVMARLLKAGETPSAVAPAPKPSPVAPLRQPIPPAPPVAPPPAPPRPAVPTAAGRRKISPAARSLAQARGVALDTLTASGPDGTIVRADVERALAQPAPAPPPAKDARAEAARRSAEMRAVIAAAMSRSKREIPHYYLAEPIPLRLTLDWLRARNADRPVTERILPVVPLLKAVALAVQAVPEVNGLYVDGQFRPSAAVHVGVAISLRGGGLVAPALHDVQAKPLAMLMRELDDLVQRCRAGRLRSSELSDPTLTVTNLGDQGVAQVQGVIYPPQVALVGFGSITDQPWVDNGALVPMPVVQASLAADHRVSDGHRGALFLRRVRDLLQAPEALDG